MPHVPLRSRAAGGGALYIEGWAVTEGREGNAGCPGIHVSACWSRAVETEQCSRRERLQLVDLRLVRLFMMVCMCRVRVWSRACGCAGFYAVYT